MNRQAYWNNEIIERSKPWWITGTEDMRIVEHVRYTTNLERCFRDALTFATGLLGTLKGTAVDLGAGVCWTSAIVSRLPGIERVIAIDFSNPRLNRIAPLVLRQFNADEEKVVRYCIDMASLPFHDASVDLAVFCQSLYMCERPVEMLHEVFRVLKAGGMVLISCEKISAIDGGVRSMLRRARHLFLHPFVRHQIQPDPSGRYEYLDSHYQAFLAESGFEFHCQGLDYPVFLNSTVNAANFFGIKR